MWQIIIHNTESTSQARKLSDNTMQSGLLGWMKLVTHYDPRQGIDMSAELARIVHPTEYFGKAKDIAQTKVLLNEYQQEVARYNAKYPKEALNKDIEMMSIRMIMPEEINNKLTGETFEDKWELIKRINKIVEDSRTTRPGETLKPKGKGPLASLREAMDGIEDDNGRSNEAQQGFYDALGELYTIMKGKGKGQGTWNPNAYGPWKGMKGKGKGKSDDDKECYNCGRTGHIAKYCKAKGKGHEGRDGKG